MASSKSRESDRSMSLNILNELQSNLFIDAAAKTLPQTQNKNISKMQKKRNNRLRDFSTQGKKVLCGKFAEKLTNNFAVGDEQNNLILYNIDNSQPIAVLNSNTSNVSSITALTFTQADEQVIVGSNRGSINAWDLNTLKIGYCLKGHTIEICCFYADRRQPSIVASGSFDTNAKLWDLRVKNCVHTLKNHNKRVSAICISPDSRTLLSGGEDGMAYAWDIKMVRPIFQYEVCSPVLSLEVSPEGIVAAGCLDRSARLYDLNPPYSLQSKTKNDTMPVTSCVFYKSNHLFTAGTDNLKVWDISSPEDIVMTDNIETSSKGILHMIVPDRIQQLAYSSGTLSYHECFLTDVNLEGQYNYTPPANNSIYNDSQGHVSPSLREIASRKGVMSTNNNGSTIVKRANSIQPHHENYLTSEHSKKVINKKSEAIARELAGIHGNINEALNNIKAVTENFNNRKNELLQMQTLMLEQHSKFLKIISTRSKSIQAILDLWMKGNIKSVIKVFSRYPSPNSSADIYVASDVLGQILKPSHIQISVQFGLAIAEKAKQMIKNKHITLVKSGLEYMLYVVGFFKEEMIRMKTFGMDKGVDLVREERIRRFDSLIEHYVEVYRGGRLRKLAEKHDETSNLAHQLMEELRLVLGKVLGSEFQP